MKNIRSFLSVTLLILSANAYAQSTEPHAHAALQNSEIAINKASKPTTPPKQVQQHVKKSKRPAHIKAKTANKYSNKNKACNKAPNPETIPTCNMPTP